jgi:adenylate cyclase
MTGATACLGCGARPRVGARFCDVCGASLSPAAAAEFKQVTVLFADVVHSMDIAAALGPERLREIMGSLFDLSASVVRRYGGTVDKFTGDGIMALFGAPVALEDHPLRACLAALDIQNKVTQLADDVRRRDGIDLRLRIGLNSGQVIAGKIGYGSAGYTAIGDQVGMAQRMESVAPPGGVMLSQSTARLVDGRATLAEPEWVHIKGAADPIPARRLVGVSEQPSARRRVATLVGRRWEMAALAGILDDAVDGHGGIVRVCGPAGIGKSRTVREISALAATRGIEVFSTYCESHTREISFHAVAGLLRATSGAAGLEPAAARARVRAEVPGADPEDVLLFDDLVGIADPDVALPQIDPDARRRRLTALVNAAALARAEPELYIVEDIHWIDAVSEAMLADFLPVIPQTRSIVVFTYRPEYGGALSSGTGGQTIGLAPLTDAQTTALVTELLGSDPSLSELIATISERAAGNPFFAEELVRDLVDRDMLQGAWGAYTSTVAAGEVSAPATLQATIAARIDRLPEPAKRTLNAAAVIGSRFATDTLVALGVEPAVDDLLAAELVDQVRYTPHPEYAFHHPLIRTVAYESQLKSARAELHRRLAECIDQTDDNAALVAEHLDAAGDFAAAYTWHMRAAAWAGLRDITAARTSWSRARDVADRLPHDHPDRAAMRIAPRTLLCGSTWRVSASIAKTGFDELRDLCAASGDKVSLAMGMAGMVVALEFSGRTRQASRLASEHVELLESIGDPQLMIGLSFAATYTKSVAGEMAETLRLAQHVVDLADGDPTKGNFLIGSPLAAALALRGTARWSLGLPGWREDLNTALAMARTRTADPFILAMATVYKYLTTIPQGVLLSDDIALTDTAQTLDYVGRTGDQFALTLAQLVRGFSVVRHGGPGCDDAVELLSHVRQEAVLQRTNSISIALVDTEIAAQRIRDGDLDSAIQLTRDVIAQADASGQMLWRGVPTTTLVEALLRRGGQGDLAEARAAIEALAAIPTDPGLVLFEVPLLRMRALLAQATGDQTGYRDYRDRYRKMVTDLGFEGHMAFAEAMP